MEFCIARPHSTLLSIQTVKLVVSNSGSVNTHIIAFPPGFDLDFNDASSIEYASVKAYMVD